ncbi:Na+/H+ antiporter [Peribacillus muralis]|uniref:Na+/H+ antiporter n=1 Tax=Peribacillus muralis TaxID=264697 RepID=A0A1B3XP23_9BACI|nr:Na+/H+ antiporter [Peribacillus muralis]AOH54956.1 Na+/H+ antiporter [Peribacillus muralis]
MSFLITMLGLLGTTILATIMNAKWPRIPLPIYQISFGAALSLLPLHLSLDFHSELFMICVIAPLLFTEGKNTSRKEMLELRKPILLLAFGLVFVTVFAGGFFIHWLIPDMPMAIAFALAATITPTDAVAVQSITKGLKLPGNMLPILEGESLFNDAAGIVAFKVALAAALTGVFSIKDASLNFIFVAIGGIVVGLLLGYLIIKLRLFLRVQGLEEIPMSIVMEVITPFAIYMAAEEVHVSGILAVVSAGVIHGIERDRLQNTTTKLQIVSTNIWSVFGYLLNGLVFTLLGFMLPSVYQEIESNLNRGSLFGISVLIVLLLLVIRFIWVYFLHDTFTKNRVNPLEQFIMSRIHQEDNKPSKDNVTRTRYAILTSVCGIHGTITLATALSIPYFMPDDSLFPMRNTVLFIAACVILLSVLLATVLLPILVKAPDESEDERLTPDEAHKIILNKTIHQLSKESNSDNQKAVYQVMDDLNEQLIDLERGITNRPDHKLIQDLVKLGANTELEVVSGLVDKGTISETAFELYKVYISRTLNYVQKSFLQRVWISIQAILFKKKLNVKWDKKWEAKLENSLDKNADLIQEFRIAQKEASKEAISLIKQQTEPENRHEVMLVIQRYNRYLNPFPTLNEREANRLQEIVSHFQLKAMQIERDIIQQMVEEDRISSKTATDLRQNLIYDEMLMIQN